MMLYQTDLVINFNINATQFNSKKYFSHNGGGGGGGGGANMYQFHQMHTQICMTLTRCNLIVCRVRLMVWSRVLKKDGYFFLNYDYFWIFLLSYYIIG